MIHTVFSSDDSVYQQCQTDLLVHTYQKVGQSGRLTRLWAGAGEPPAFPGYVFKTPSYAYHPVSGDHYPPYNRLFGLAAWLRETPPPEETILHLEPDFIFTSPIEAEVERGRPIAHPFWHMYVRYAPTVARRHCAHPERIQPVGVPKLIHRDDLIEILPYWQAKTEAIRDDPQCREEAHWWSDMWGYVCAAAELDYHHTVQEFGHHTSQDRSYPLIHYCVPVEVLSPAWQWYKGDYVPWQTVPPPPATAPYAMRVLIRELNELAVLKRAL